jgi:multiple sugar transport system substrate-binding protein
MSAEYSRRDLLAGVLVAGTVSATALYLAPGGRPLPSIGLTLWTGADPTGPTGARQLLAEMWNGANPNAPVTLVTKPGSSIDQRNEMQVAAESGIADVLNLDMIDIPYFAGRGLIAPIVLNELQVFLPETLQASRVGNDPRYWAAPFNTDVGMLFERLRPGQSSAATQAPSLSTVIDNLVPDNSGQFAGQLQPSSSDSEEAFVVNILEHAISRDSGILDANGFPAYDLRRWQQATKPLHDVITKNRITKCASEADTLAASERQKLRYMRNWPVYYRRLQQDGDPDVQAGRIRVSPLPTGILGGQSLAIVKKSPHAAQATELIRFLTAEPAQKIIAAHGLAAVRSAAYSDPDLGAFIPHLESIRGAVESARLRPIHANYRAFSTVMANHMKNLLQRNIDLPSQFIDEMRGALS